MNVGLFLVLIFIVGSTLGQNHGTDTLATPEEVRDQLIALEGVVESLGKQLMHEQLFVEERIRSEGMSGMKKVRQYHEGTSTYYTDTYIGDAALAMHDHSNYDRTMGIGEFIAVMDGVEFRTRHNDYKLRMPSRTSGDYQATEFIEQPPVPPEVTNKANVPEQIKEMKEWFRAFKEQDTSIRDYRPYFKPNLCIVEGAWTLPTKEMEEPYQSDRHHIDATSWDDLVEKIAFTSYTGAKHNLENFAFLPSKLYDITGGVPKTAQWNYRIICSPLSFDLPTSYFKVQNDLAYRLSHQRTIDQIKESRAARFKIVEYDTERIIKTQMSVLKTTYLVRSTMYTILDQMMAEFPGLNNYGANLTDVTLGLEAKDISLGGDHPLNAAYYSRWYKYDINGAMGVSTNHRGFNDENLWVAANTQPHIMPLSVNSCVQDVCERETRRVSFALPLEVVYTTPLFNWNPYDVAYYEGDPNTDPDAMSVTADGRNGTVSAQFAYNGTNSRTFYRTPVFFYESGDVELDYADTAQDSVGVLDKNGKVWQMAASGPRIITPEIGGVGAVRLRYPIFPVHSEGSTVGEELEALKEIVMKLNQYSYLLEESPGLSNGSVSNPFAFLRLRETHRDPPGAHSHEFQMPTSDKDLLMSGQEFTVTTSLALGHTHDLVLRYNQTTDTFFYVTCDGMADCWDGHPHDLALES